MQLALCCTHPMIPIGSIMSIGSILSIESIEKNVQNYVHSTISFHDWVIDCSTGQRGGKRGHPCGKHQAKRERKGCKGGGGGEGGKIEICPLDVQSLSIVQCTCPLYNVHDHCPRWIQWTRFTLVKLLSYYLIIK